ncbi:MAG: hypothetical protein EBT15_10390 [Betaproteobacteria bacterium]|nr:hypothetical protein [Betaproteobacteria bacterium]
MDNTNSLPFVYVVTASLGAAVGATSSTTLIMQADSRFELMGIMGTGGVDATTENSLQYPNSFTVSIRDQTTGRDLMSAPVPQRVLCGNAFKQFLEKRGIIFEPQSNLLFTFTNLTAAANNITLALHGYKIIL